MALPATAGAIYDLLVSDAELLRLLGVYQLPDGQSLPAIAALKRNERLPEGTAIGGVEVVITTPRLSPEWLLDGGYRSQPTFRIYVSEWPGADRDQLQAVAERVIGWLPGATTVQIDGDPPGEGLGLLDQFVIRWVNPEAHVSGGAG